MLKMVFASVGLYSVEYQELFIFYFLMSGLRLVFNTITVPATYK